VRSAVGRTARALLLTSIVCLLVLLAAPNRAASANGAIASTEQPNGFAAPIVRTIPNPDHADWARNPIDKFILEKLNAAKLAPSRPASRQSLIRRAYLDLIGIPPTPEQVDAFVADPDPNAFDHLVDALLASPQYGERWARHWLDLARYAESEGFKADETRPNAWRYRDYVIDSLNADKPFDRFVKEQVAGDELYPNDPQARIATYFLRSYPDESNARQLYQRRQEILNDQTDVIGSVFLGMTVGCARCHDHKYDPISQRDYYRLQAFLADTRADDHMVIADDEAIREHDAKQAIWEQKTASIREEMAKLEAPKRKKLLKEYFDKYPADIQAALTKPEADRTPMDWLLHYKAALYMEPESHQYLASSTTCAAALTGDNKKRWQELNGELHQYDDIKPKPLPLATGVIDAGPVAPVTSVLKRGLFDAPKEEAPPGFPHVLSTADPVIQPTSDHKSTGRRSALANWIASDQNPMTAKVMVNRVWSHHFGRGIVNTPSDFGARGDAATEPELLDWLAQRFISDGWRLKSLHRLIMTSATYQEAAEADAGSFKADPDDKLFSRFPLKRLEAEVIRDSLLSVAGVLNPKMHGPSIFPEIPKTMEVRGGWAVTASEAERNRRSIYVFVRRNTRYPMFEAFDMPDPTESCPRRYVSVTSTQALMLLNSDLTVNWAQHLAGRVLTDRPQGMAGAADRAYQLAYGRHADADEMQSALRFVDGESAAIADRASRGQPVALPLSTDGKGEIGDVDSAHAAALVDFCHVLMNSNEFVYSN
jgi:hypothetical protein